MAANMAQTILINDQMCNDASIIANELNKYFAHVADDILSTQAHLAPSENYEALSVYVNLLLVNCHKESNIPRVTKAQIEKSLKSLDTAKATGIDQMAAYFIQIATPALARHLCIIINTSIETGVFPKLWKQAKVFQFLKVVRDLI